MLTTADDIGSRLLESKECFGKVDFSKIECLEKPELWYLEYCFNEKHRKAIEGRVGKKERSEGKSGGGVNE